MPKTIKHESEKFRMGKMAICVAIALFKRVDPTGHIIVTPNPDGVHWDLTVAR
jgi:hypothetical protein